MVEVLGRVEQEAVHEQAGRVRRGHGGARWYNYVSSSVTEDTCLSVTEDTCLSVMEDANGGDRLCGGEHVLWLAWPRDEVRYGGMVDGTTTYW
jgi:hypothetical protein